MILSEVKEAIGVPSDSTSFDVELLSYLNQVASQLTIMGVESFDSLEIQLTTDWPIEIDLSLATVRLYKSFVNLFVKSLYDPSSNETLSKSLSTHINRVESMLSFKIEEDLEEVNE